MIVDLEVNYSDRRWHRFDFIKYIKLKENPFKKH